MVLRRSIAYANAVKIAKIGKPSGYSGIGGGATVKILKPSLKLRTNNAQCWPTLRLVLEKVTGATLPELSDPTFVTNASVKPQF